MKKQKKTAEQAIKDGDFIALDKALLDSVGIGVQVVLPAADHHRLNIDGLMAQRDGAKVHKLARTVAFTIRQCQLSGTPASTIVQVDAKGFPALAMGVIPLSESIMTPVIVVSIAKKPRGKSCKTK